MANAVMNELPASSDIRLSDGVLAIVRSDASRKLINLIHRVAPQSTSVLITGETGSGKELIARALHMFSLRNSKPWIDLNCAALPEHLIESELFGYEKGAFSGANSVKQGFFEMADGGTLFLDEIGELDARLQVKLLRVLDGAPFYRLGGAKKVTVNVRIIAATNRNLEAEVKNGKFRRDLYHRLNQVEICVAPLRQRPEDIQALADHFLHAQREAATFSPDAIRALRSYSWPGNVRELKNVIVHAAMMMNSDTEVIGVQDLPRELSTNACTDAGAAEVTVGELDQMERQMILRALERNHGDQTRAAEDLGISRRTLSRKLKTYREEGESVPGVVLGDLSSGQQQCFRASLECPVKVKPRNAAPGIVRSINVSAQGLGVCEIQMGGIADSDLELEFHLPDKTLIKAKARLSWMDTKGSGGIRLCSVQPQGHLEAWLEQQIKSENWARLL